MEIFLELLDKNILSDFLDYFEKLLDYFEQLLDHFEQRLDHFEQRLDLFEQLSDYFEQFWIILRPSWNIRVYALFYGTFLGSCLKTSLINKL